MVLRSGAGALVASSEQKTIKKKPPKKPMEEEQFTEVSFVSVEDDQVLINLFNKYTLLFCSLRL